MCKKVMRVKIPQTLQVRKTCPKHPKEKLRANTGCPTCGWPFSTGAVSGIQVKRAT
jgi:hypothetical protein